MKSLHPTSIALSLLYFISEKSLHANAFVSPDISSHNLKHDSTSSLFMSLQEPPQPQPTQKKPQSQQAPLKRLSLRRYLNNVVQADPSYRDLESLSLSIQMACKTISRLVNRAGINSLSTPPSFNTEEDRDQALIQYDYRMNSMKRLDQLSTIVLRNALRFTGKLQSVKKAKDNLDDELMNDGLNQDLDFKVEEHEPGVLIASTLDSKYVAVFDPLDGSGNADAAICTGTVFGIYEQTEEAEQQNKEAEDDEGLDGIDNVVLGGGDGMDDLFPSIQERENLVDAVLQPGKKLVAAGYCLYSSSTILVFTLGNGTHGFTLDPQINEFVLTHPNIKIPPRGNVYSCNEANSEGWADDVKAYLHALKSGENETKSRYALRYVGSLVGDIHRTLMYGGIFFYPGDAERYPNGNLQLVYKSSPLSYVIEQAGGMSTNGKVGLLDVKPEHVHVRSPCFIGSPEDINEMKKYIQHEE